MNTAILVQAVLTFFWPVMGIATFTVGTRLARRYVRAVEARATASAEHQHLAERVAELEETLDDASAQITRLQAAQEFTTRLLTERTSRDMHV